MAEKTLEPRTAAERAAESRRVGARTVPAGTVASRATRHPPKRRPWETHRPAPTPKGWTLRVEPTGRRTAPPIDRSSRREAVTRTPRPVDRRAASRLARGVRPPAPCECDRPPLELEDDARRSRSGLLRVPETRAGVERGAHRPDRVGDPRGDPHELGPELGWGCVFSPGLQA